MFADEFLIRQGTQRHHHPDHLYLHDSEHLDACCFIVYILF